MTHFSASRKILVIGEEVTLAHVTRPLYLANALNREHLDISFACGPRYEKMVKMAGYQHYPLTTIPSEVFLRRLARGEPLYTYSELKQYVEEEIRLCEELSPDLIIGDFRISLGISSDILKVPYIALSNAHWSPYSTLSFPLPEHAFAKLFGEYVSKKLLSLFLPLIHMLHIRSFNRLRKYYGLMPVRTINEMYTYATWALYTDIPGIAPTKNIPSNHRYIGPVLWSPDIALPDWWKHVPEDKTLIYVTMGSSGDIRLLNKILTAIQRSDSIGVVATAGRISIQPSSKVFVADYLPGLEVLKKASLVMCSGGSATAYQALSLGVPILAFPSNADQFFTMESIQSKGAGLLIRPMAASADIITQAMHDMVYNKTFKESADKMASEISMFDAKKLFSDFIENSLGTIRT